MKRSEFINRLSGYCEFEEQELSLDTPMKSIEGYSSFAVMSMVAFVDENFGMKLTAKQIMSLIDFNSFITLIGEGKFENE